MWLFSKKDKAEAPLPPSEELLSFPKSSQVARNIEPEKIKQAVGLGPKPSEPPEKDVQEVPEEIEEPKQPFMKSILGKKIVEGPPEEPEQPMRPIFNEKMIEPIITQQPFFIRMSHYQKVLELLGSVRSNTIDLDSITEKLNKSKYNEDKTYENLKKELKKIHDHLLVVDELIFKENKSF